MAQPSPIHSWKLIVPWVVSAVKSGATELIRNVMAYLLMRAVRPMPELRATPQGRPLQEEINQIAVPAAVALRACFHCNGNCQSAQSRVGSFLFLLGGGAASTGAWEPRLPPCVCRRGSVTRPAA